jgi:hypothetical protein
VAIVTGIVTVRVREHLNLKGTGKTGGGFSRHA